MVVGGNVSVETLEQLLDAFTQHDLDRIMEFFSDDATFDMPKGPQPRGYPFRWQERGSQGTGSLASAESPTFITVKTATG